MYDVSSYRRQFLTSVCACTLRDAYHESVLLGNELTKKATEAEGRTLGDSDAEDDDGHGRLSSKVGAELGDALGSTDEPNVDGKYKALFAMDFMQKAREQQQARAREEAKSILRVLESMEDEVELEEDGPAVAAASVAAEKEKAAKLAAARKEMTALLDNGGKQSMTLRDQKKSSIQEDSSAPVDNPWLGSGGGETRSSVSSNKRGGVLKDSASRKSRVVGDTAAMTSLWTAEEETTGTGSGIVAELAGSNKKKKRKKNKKSGAKPVDIATGDSTHSDPTPPQSTSSSAPAKPERKPLLLQKSQVI